MILFIFIVFISATVLIPLLIKPHIIENKKRNLAAYLRQSALGLELLHLQDNITPQKINDATGHIIKAGKGISMIEYYPAKDNLIPVSDSIKLNERDRESLLDGKPVYKWDNLALTLYYPISSINNKKPYPIIVIYGNGADLQESVNNELFYYYLLFFCFGILFVVTSLWLTFRITAPLIYLSEVTKDVAHGSSSLSITKSFKGEVGAIVDNLNIMIARINAAHDELESYTKNLEHIVELRTQRLNKALEEIYRQKEYVENIISAVGALIVLLDKEGRIMLFNRTAEETLGYKEPEVLGRLPWEIYIPEESVPIAIESFKQMTEGVMDSVEITMLTKEGAKKTVLWRTTVIREDNKIKYLLATGLDISEKKRLEQYIIEAQRFQSISTMLSGLSHNFNNLLVGIMGYAGLARLRLSSMSEGNDVNEIGKHLEIIENSSQKAADLIKHLRGFTKRTDYEKVSMSLNEPIMNINALATVVFGNNIKLQIDLAEDLNLIKADKLNIQQALMNICINAKEAMPEGGVLSITTKNVSIKQGEINMLPEGKYVLAIISDSGHGIEKEIISRIFEPFFTTKSMIDHMGLGLTQSYSIITDHRGDITLDTVPGKGTTFRIYLPTS